MSTITNKLKKDPVERQDIEDKHLPFSNNLYELAKRAFDVIVALIGLIILAPFFVLFSILIMRDTPGPAFYWCQRMGKDGHPFRMLKFRTMYDKLDPCTNLPLTCDDDERITPFGGWLRDTKINELPQLWNVLIGQMSLVGPRPEDVGIAESWPEELRAELLSVKPGITSPASILYHDEEHLLTRANVMGEYLKNIMPDKIRLDKLYIRNRSFSSDLDVIFWTLVIIIPRMAKAKIPEGYLFAGPFFRLIHRYISWFFIDLLVALISVAIMGVFWRIEQPLNWGFNQLAILALFIAFIFSSFNSIVGLNRILWERATVEDGLRLALSSLTVTLLLILLDYSLAFFHWLSMPPLPVVMICAIGLTAQIGFLIVRFRWRMITAFASRWITLRHNAQGFGEKVLIIGAGEGYQIANWLLRRGQLQYIFSIVGLVDDDIPTIQGMRLEGCMVLGRTSDLPELVKKYDVGIILFTSGQISNEIKEYVFNLCQTSNVRVAYIDNLIESVRQQFTRPVTSLELSLWSENHLQFLAMHDYVTGLPNRFLFQDQLIRSLAYAKRYKTTPVVLFITLDGHKPDCDKPDGKIWDTLLKEFTKCLLKIKRESDILARLDESVFGLIMDNIVDENALSVVAKRIFRSIAEPIIINLERYQIVANITFCTGLDRYSPGEIGDIHQIYNQGKSLALLEDDMREQPYV